MTDLCDHGYHDIKNNRRIYSNGISPSVGLVGLILKGVSTMEGSSFPLITLSSHQISSC